MKNSLKKNIIWNTLGTGANAFTSLFLLVIVTRINGLDNAGVFSFAFSTACILFIFATYAGRIFQVTDTTDIKDKEFILSRIITCLLSILFCVLFVLINGYNISKSLIIITLCLYKTIESFCDVLYGILQKNEMLDIVGKSYLLKSVLGILVFLVVDLITKNMLYSVLSMIGISIIVSIFIDYRISRKLVKIDLPINKKHLKQIFIKGFTVFLISFIPVIIVNAPKYVIDHYLVDKLQAVFGIIIMPATVISLFSQFIIHPMLTSVTNMYRKKDYESLKKMLYKMMLLVLVFGILCIVGAYIIGIPVLELVYGVSLKNYKIELVIILLASTLSTTAGVISPFLIAMRHNFSQVIIGIITIIIEVILSVLFIKKYSIAGVTYAYLIAMAINLIMYSSFIYVLLKRKIRGEN